MPAEKKPMRYAHLEGQTDVCFNETGSCLVTCGSDGDIRIWENIDDDDPKSINVGEKAYSFALMNGKVVTASSNNAIQMHTFPNGDPDGILTRFTTNANHVVFNSNGTKIAAGSGDFLVKVMQVEDSSEQKTLRGHSAPVLSVAFDPKDEYLLLAVPVDKTIQFYERDAWMKSFTLSDDFITQPLNVVTWSPCGKFIVGGSIDGRIVAWNVLSKVCLERVQHDKGFTICCLAWHPKLAQVAYTDNEGNLGVLENVCQGSVVSAGTKVSSAAKKDYDELFDGDDDDEDFLNGDMIDHEASVVNEDDDDNVTPISGHAKKRAIFDDDDNLLDVPSLKANDIEKPDGEEDDLSTKAQAIPYTSKPYSGPMPTPPQKAFQAGSTPSHLSHRFMMWNSVGVIRCYNDEQDNAIDIEFHDTSIHHAMHLTNTLNHAIADLSQEAVLLACEGTEELASKLQCLHFSSWDNNKEWMVDMPKGEDIQAVCLGQGWVACATNAFLVRIFTVGGAQKEIFSLLGPVVCMAGHGEQLLIVYHRGTGFDGDQCLGVQLLEIGKRKRQVLHGDPLPMSRKCFLSWLGFSAEGSPCYVDSEGVVRLLNRSLGYTWTPVCLTREHCKGKSDHYWVVGVHENPQQLRCIPCKGSRFPPTLPRPAMAILPFKLPYCQITTEKGQMEVSASQKSPALAGSSSRILDNMSKLAKKTPPAASKSDSLVIKPLVPRAKPKQGQTALFSNIQPKCTAKKTQEKENPTPPPPTPVVEKTESKKSKTGFQLWLEENRQSILSETSELDESEIIKEGMSRFRALTNEERMMWTEKAKGDDSADQKKRKREQQENCDSQESPEGDTQDHSSTVKKRKPFDQSTTNKLSAFAFKKD
ncbi:hypothetical protein GDO78_010595 [Eleutherodactylus coqui]|uniref:WD repeat and HMG-box DNA-binding protein 1 n=1 Tax=Eleutherodactylus coqui TaxID=57060 RepID=A0A8J6F5G4_ELECQ|nr:hypothetical protein GDO78_010595 [Eleutherodactylus coqui]